MPPRRSTRTVSVEPPSAPVTSKRKRTNFIDEEEPVDKPQSSRTRRSASARTSVGLRARAASNKRSASGTLSKVVESDDEQSDSPPPEKKKRPSIDAVEESASEDELPVKKARKPPTKKTGAPVRKLQKVDSDEESVGTPPPPPVATPKRKPTPHRPTEEESDGEEKSLFEDAPPPVAPSPVKSVVAPEEPKGPQKRLVIHMMALVNFKSYAGRQVIGPFHKSFSAIVGPNGSGKSNTIDALLFVFGYRASKMRQGKVSELIHNSASHPDLDECSVEVHFREIIDLPGHSDFTVVPGSQLTVARYAYKNNASKYTINGRSSTYNEVQTLLKEKGIDLDHNRFLILQGEVESIAQMKPKGSNEHEDGLLEYLEDIIGTSQYKEPIEKAAQDMEELQDLRSEKLNRLRLVEKEKNALEEKKKEAEDYLRLQNEHVRAQSRLWQFYLWTCLINDEKLSQKIAGIEKDLRDEVDKHKDDIEHLDLMHKHYAQRQATYDEVQMAAEEAAKELKQKEKLLVKYEEEKKHKVATVKKLKKTVTSDTNARAAAHRTITESSEKMESQQQRLEELELSLDEEQKELVKIRDSLKGKTQAFHDQIEVKQRELQPWTAKIDSKQAQIDVATSERNALVKKAEEVQEQSREAEAALQELQLQRDAKSKQREALKAEKEQLQRDAKAFGDRLHTAQENVKSCRAKASSARQKVEEAKSSHAEKKSQNKVLDSLMGLKSTGRVDGFHGRLGSLGKIDDKYDIAISTACGALNNMVVDTVEQGQTCINYLRSQNVGRASFMVLEKLGNLDMRPIQTPENVPRLFDLITPKEPRFAPAFYKAISNTLVAKDMEQANRIAFGETKRWRVVTLAGQLIDISGTMSGGGTQPARGGMSSKFAADTIGPETLRRYEQEHEQAQKTLSDAMEEEKQVEAHLEKLKKRVPEIEVEFQKLGMEIETGKKRIAEAEKRAKDLKSQTKPDAGDTARVASLDKEIQIWTEELSSLQNASSRIEKDIKDLEQKILDVGGAKLLAQKSKVEGISLHITLANEEITKAEVIKAKAEKDLVKLAKSLEEMSTQVGTAEREVAELDEQLEEVQTFVQELSERVEEAKTAAENSKDDLRKLKKELDKKTEEVQGFRQREVELKQGLDDAKKESADNEAQLQHWQDQHETLKLEKIDEDDEDEDEDNEDGPKNPETPPPADGEGDVETKVDPDNEGGDRHRSKNRDRTPSTELHTYSTEELSKFRKRELVADVELLAEKLQRAKPNLSVLSEYKKKEEDFFNRAQEVDNVTKQRDEQKATYDGLRKRRLDEFMAGFSVIGLRLKEMYQMITLGGNAELELVDSMDPFSEGIVFSVMPPKKSWKNISNLSGGEKTLSSLALVFALHVFKPTPLYFMDEIDAALDFRNVSIVANYIKDRTKNAQFIIISLRNDMFELSHRLIGIYKTSNMTKSICINNTILKAGLNNNGGSSTNSALPQLVPVS